MKSKNIYQLPIKEDFPYIIQDSPAHNIVKEDKVIYDLTKAIDFTCREGTEVYSALEGKVIVVFNKVNKTWNKDIEPPAEIMEPGEQDGNYVVVEHSKEEFTIYSHLKLNGIKVREGEEIKAGQLLGFSGNTGWSIGPHLHFMVHNFPKRNNGGYRSLTPHWEKGIENELNKKRISFNELPKEWLK